MSIHLGQAGVQMGEAIWTQYGLEHGIGMDGQRMTEMAEGCDTQFHECPAFYSENGEGRYVPRAVFIDTEPMVIGGLNAFLLLPFYAISFSLSQQTNCKRLRSVNCLTRTISSAVRKMLPTTMPADTIAYPTARLSEQSKPFGKWRKTRTTYRACCCTTRLEEARDPV